MTFVAGKNRVNRPYFFTDTSGGRVEFPSFGTGQGDLEGHQLNQFRMYVAAGQIDIVDAQVAPSNIVLPSITGIARVGETLTGDDGEWAGTPEPVLSRQWMADDEPIEGATSATYEIAVGDIGAVITLSVTATNDAGSDTAISDPTEPVEAAISAPVNTSPPAVTGDAQVGETLSATNGVWTGNPAPSYSLQWERSADGESGWEAIAGSASAAYELVADDEQMFLRCIVTAENPEGINSAESNVVGPVAAVEAAP